MSKIIITCAVTGGAHTPSMSPHLPVTPEQIADQSIEAAEAGASIIHLHARNPEDGRPTGDPAIFRRFLQRIKGATDAVVNISTGGGGPTMAIAERTIAAQELRPEMASLNMGSVNLNLSGMARSDRAWQYDWEKPFLESTYDLVFRNTWADIEWILTNIGANGTRFEFECYDVSHLYALRHFVDRGLVKAPFFIQTAFGMPGAIGAHPEDLMHQKRTMDRLFGGEDYKWSVLAAGVHQMRIATMAALMGANVRVGLEDGLYISRGQLAVSNAEQVRKIRRILDEFGMEIATPDEARTMLGLKGGDAVGF